MNLYGPTIGDSTVTTTQVYTFDFPPNAWTTIAGTTARMFDVAEHFWSRRNVHREKGLNGGAALKPIHERAPRKALVLRASYHGMCRLPCYRGARTR